MKTGCSITLFNGRTLLTRSLTTYRQVIMMMRIRMRMMMSQSHKYLQYATFHRAIGAIPYIAMS